MDTDNKNERRGAEAAKIRTGFLALRFSAFCAPLRLAPSVFIRVNPWLIAVFIICFALRAFCADADYKQVLISTNADSVRVRLPLTDVTGKVRVKEISPDGFGTAGRPQQNGSG